jgi:hypothetical protein
MESASEFDLTHYLNFGAVGAGETGNCKRGFPAGMTNKKRNGDKKTEVKRERK